MSHGDQLSELPPDFRIVGHTQTAPFAAIAHNEKPLWGIQFHPEVTHSPMGKALIGEFILSICDCQPNWTMESVRRVGGKTYLDLSRPYFRPQGIVYGATKDLKLMYLPQHDLEKVE